VRTRTVSAFRRALAALLASAALVAVAGCGDDEAATSTPATGTAASGGVALPAMTDVTLVLDFLPGGVHAGIYAALEKGYYEQNNIDLKIIQPTSTADTLKLIDAGKADVGIADGIDVATQISDGRDAQAIGAVVQRPLGGLITLTSAGITDPKQLEGKTVGVTGVPSDDAILKTVVTDAGGDPAKVKVVTIGFNGVQNLESGKVDAFTGFWPADGVQVEVDGKPVTTFKLDEHGGPAYPGLMFFSTQKRIAADGPRMAAFMDATVRGYQDAITDPAVGLEALMSRVPALDRAVTEAQLDAYGPLFAAGGVDYGTMDPAILQSLSDFLMENGLIKEAIAPDRFATSAFLPKG